MAVRASSALTPLDGIQAAIKGGRMGKTAGGEMIAALRENFEKRQQALDLDNEALVKRIEAQTILTEAATKAATESGARKKATLDIANAKARSLREDADRDARRAVTQWNKTVDDETITRGFGAGVIGPMQAAMKRLFPTGGGGLNNREMENYAARRGQLGVVSMPFNDSSRFDAQWKAAAELRKSKSGILPSLSQREKSGPQIIQVGAPEMPSGPIRTQYAPSGDRIIRFPAIKFPGIIIERTPFERAIGK